MVFVTLGSNQDKEFTNEGNDLDFLDVAKDIRFYYLYSSPDKDTSLFLSTSKTAGKIEVGIHLKLENHTEPINTVDLEKLTVVLSIFNVAIEKL